MKHDPALITTLTQVVGEANVITDDAELAYYSQDIYRAMAQAVAVVRPGSVDEICELVKLAASTGLAIVPRGGGMSYTDSYLHATDHGITLDLKRLDRIIEISCEDMYVTVESGCTWKKLNDELARYNLRPPYWGPLSGLHATVGGALSQNSVFWGGTAHGSAAESVMGMDVVLGDGSILGSGAHSKQNGKPFMRNDGPDLTGLFIGDSGALGIKGVVTLKLLPKPGFVRYASFSFEHDQQACAAMSEIARQRLASECYAFDAGYSNRRIFSSNKGLVGDIKTLASVAKKSGVLEAIKIALAGRRFASKAGWGVHVNIEGRSRREVDDAFQAVLGIVKQHHGWEEPNSLPKIIGATPFPPANSMIGPNGERWVPIHGQVAHSQVIDTINKIKALHNDNRGVMDEMKITTGFLLTTVGSGGLLIEPVFLWPDEIYEVHRRHVEPEFLNANQPHGPNEPARQEVARMRDGIRDIFLEQGAVHFQIGKYYPYRQGRKALSWEMLERIKSLLDRDNVFNPGQLGLAVNNDGELAAPASSASSRHEDPA